MPIIKRIILIICVASLMMPTSFLSSLSVSSANTIEHSLIENSQSFEDHIIEGVPYVSQETGFYCFYASSAMIFQYYGINASLHEVLYNSGIGHSLVYIKSDRRFITSHVISQSENNFLASLYGLSYSYSYQESVSVPFKEDYWEIFWLKVKENITKNIPVMTSVDPFSLPYLREKYNITDNETHGGHAVLIVGFNDSNQTVCYHDPAAGIWNDDENGTYVHLTKDIFKDAVENSIMKERYQIVTFTNRSEVPPKSKDERFKLAHEQNIKKLLGVPEFYPDIYKIPFISKFGIDALKCFKKHLRFGRIRRRTTVYFYSKFINRNNEFYSVFNYATVPIEKLNISQYLDTLSNELEDENLSQICRYESNLFQNESDNWNKMNDYFYILYWLGSKYRLFFRILIKSIPTTLKMKKVLNEIISIEKAIISGPAK